MSQQRSDTWWVWMCMAAIVIGLIIWMAGCADETPPSRTDVDEADIEVNLDGFHVEASADRYPNIGWRCIRSNGAYVTTDRAFVIVVNDPNCTDSGKPVVVGSGTPEGPTG